MDYPNFTYENVLNHSLNIQPC